MTVDFWAVIGSNSISSRETVESALSDIAARLSTLCPTELIAFQDHLGLQVEALERTELASIPVELADGRIFKQTADHFLYARCACVLAGVGALTQALEHANHFARFVDPALQSAELLLYLARNEYQARTGQRMTGAWIPR